MINWNPFKNIKKSNPNQDTEIQIYGPGNKNAQVINLTCNQNNIETHIILGQHPQMAQTLQT